MDFPKNDFLSSYSIRQLRSEQFRIISYSMQIKISVSDPEVRKEYGGMKQFYIYSIKGQDQKGPFQIQRRYSDFDLLRSTILKRWPGYFIPSLPSKVKLNNSDQEFLQIRSLYLQKFLQQLSQKKLIWYSEQIQFFVRINNLSCQKVLGNFAKVDYREISYRYNSNLKNFEKSNQPKHITQIESFQKQLQSQFVKIQGLRVQYEEIYNSQRKYNKKYAKVLNSLFEGYEGKVRQVQQNEKLMLRKQCIQSREKLVELLKQVPLHGIFQEIRRQKREIMAFQQILQNRQGFQKEIKQIESKIKDKQSKIQELKVGKQSFLSKIRKVDNAVQIEALQKGIQKYKQQLKTLNQIFSFLNYILAEEQIIFFKKERLEAYYKMVKALAREELKIIKGEKQFWSLVGSHGFQIEENPVKEQVSQQVHQKVEEAQKTQNFQKRELSQKVQEQPSLNDKQQKIDQHYQRSKQSPKQQKEPISNTELGQKKLEIKQNDKAQFKTTLEEAEEDSMQQKERPVQIGQEIKQQERQPQFNSNDSSSKQENSIKSPQIVQEKTQNIDQFQLEPPQHKRQQQEQPN